jgi:hypothetical protein
MTPILALPQPDPVLADWPALPTETEIYILPDGRVVIADLPVELAPVVAHLGAAEPCALPADDPKTDDQ